MTALQSGVPLTGGAGEVYDVLDRAPVRWTLVRPPRDESDDIDILVAADDLGQALHALRNRGFVEEPAHGRGTHRFLVGHDGARFVRVDIVTSLDFGPLYCLRTRLADACLDRRAHTDAGWTLHPVDELWSTALHVLVDDATHPEDAERSRRMRALATIGAEPVDDADWRELVQSLLPATLTPGDLVRLLTEPRLDTTHGEIDALRWTARNRCLALAATSRDGLGHLLRKGMLRGLERPLQWRGRRGLLVAVLGPDGAGKSTLLDALATSWPWPVRRVYLGLWPDAHGEGRLSALLWPLRRPFRAMTRYARGRAAGERGMLVLFDRYVYDAAAPPRGRHRLLKRAYFRLLLRCAPAPDLVLLLDAPGEVLFARKGEMDPVILDDYRHAVLDHVTRVSQRRGRPRVVKVDALQPPTTVALEATSAIWSLAAQRLNGRRPAHDDS